MATKKKSTLIKQTKADNIFDAFNIFFMIVILFIELYPLYFTIIASFSDPTAVNLGKTMFWVHDFTLEPYKNVMNKSEIWIGYRNTIFYTFFGTIWNLVLTLPTAYVLSKKDLPYRSVVSWYFLFTMYFGGGMIPTYLLVRDLHLLNTPVTIILLGGLSVGNMITTRIFFQTSIPKDLYEAARIDGASEFRQFFGIALPLSAPIIAVMALYYGVGRWNDWFGALIYLNDSELSPLQLVLRRILILNQSGAGSGVQYSEDQLAADPELRKEVERMKHMAEGMKYSLIWIASAPLLIAYPFVQKYFVKGVMVGSLKG